MSDIVGTYPLDATLSPPTIVDNAILIITTASRRHVSFVDFDHTHIVRVYSLINFCWQHGRLRGYFELHWGCFNQMGWSRWTFHGLYEGKSSSVIASWCGGVHGSALTLHCQFIGMAFDGLRKCFQHRPCLFSICSDRVEGYELFAGYGSLPDQVCLQRISDYALRLHDYWGMSLGLPQWVLGYSLRGLQPR